MVYCHHIEVVGGRNMLTYRFAWPFPADWRNAADRRIDHQVESGNSVSIHVVEEPLMTRCNAEVYANLAMTALKDTLIGYSIIRQESYKTPAGLVGNLILCRWGGSE